jgi:spore coat polysaccharide biosynthesis predicted glycosyltransferase SpsG
VKKEILIVYSLSKISGLGHYKRSLILENFLKKSNNINKVSLKDVKFTKKNAERIINIVNKKTVTKVFFDFDSAHLKNLVEIKKILIYCKNISVKTIGIDTLRYHYNILDYVWIPSPHKNKTIKGKNIIFGWDKIIINRPKNNNKKISKGITILLGGSYNEYVIKNLPKFLNKHISKIYNFNWILGNLSSKKNLKNLDQNHKVFYNLKSIDKILSLSGYVFCLYGLSFYESLSYGIPTSCYITKKNYTKDIEEINYIKKKKLAYLDNNLEQSVLNLVKLLNNNKICKIFSKNSKEKLLRQNFNFLNQI